MSSPKWIDDIVAEMGRMSDADVTIDLLVHYWSDGKPLYEVRRPKGRIEVHAYLHPGQMEAWQSDSRVTMIVAGFQSGKTSLLPLITLREILVRGVDKARGSGQYLVVGPTLQLLKRKCIPEYTRLFVDILKLGTYNGTDYKITLDSSEARQFFGGIVEIQFSYASKSESLESITASHAALDECGQPEFKLASYEAIIRRCALLNARIHMASTPYNMGWFYERTRLAEDPDSGYSVVNFSTFDNPIADREAITQMVSSWQKWRVDMFLYAKFTRPAGLILDVFDPLKHIIDPMKEDGTPRKIPHDWNVRVGGIDFGSANSAAVMIAQAPESGRWYVYASQRFGKIDIQEQAEELDLLNRSRSAGDFPANVDFAGGAPGEASWRERFTALGMPVRKPPVTDVETGISCIYALLSQGRLVIFGDQLDLIDEIQTYSRICDEEGVPTIVIDKKGEYHLLDALRYACSLIMAEHGDVSAQQAIQYQV